MTANIPLKMLTTETTIVVYLQPMNLTASIDEDISTSKPDTGSYEWWYFDARDHNGEYQIVVIFLRGMPVFKPIYIPAGFQSRPCQIQGLSVSRREYFPVQKR